MVGQSIQQIKGPMFGYFPNAAKTWLVTKYQYHQKAKATFSSTSVNITCEGRPHLGAPIGSQAFVEQFVGEKVKGWKQT